MYRWVKCNRQQATHGWPITRRDQLQHRHMDIWKKVDFVSSHRQVRCLSGHYLWLCLLLMHSRSLRSSSTAEKTSVHRRICIYIYVGALTTNTNQFRWKVCLWKLQYANKLVWSLLFSIVKKTQMERQEKKKQHLETGGWWWKDAKHN